MIQVPFSIRAADNRVVTIRTFAYFLTLLNSLAVVFVLISCTMKFLVCRPHLLISEGKHLAFRKLSSLTILAMTLILLALTVSTYAAISVNKSINTSGSIAASPGLGVYSDSACTVPITTIDWGSISPGGTVTNTVYVKNTGGSSLTLSMAASNWNPTSANGPLTITWNKSGTTLTSGQSTAATITLSVSSSITGITSFSVQITISGTG
jgi:hypothetical protein